MSYDALTYLSDQLKEQVGFVTESLAAGDAKDFAEYQKAVGKIQGLITAQSLISDLAKRLEESND